MTKITIEIKDCSECPYCKVTHVTTSDWFEDVSKWRCQKAHRIISGYVETFDKTAVPDWCPARA